MYRKKKRGRKEKNGIIPSQFFQAAWVALSGSRKKRNGKIGGLQARNVI
jgi:hypothetical protein